MNKSGIIMVTSCKGGVGKSTVAANLALFLAKRGKRVLLVDCDFGMSCLDLIMGLEDRMLFNLSDIISGRVPLEKALTADSRTDNLWLCGAPSTPAEEIGTEQFSSFIEDAGEKLKCDYIIIDTPGDIGLPFKLAAFVSGLAIVVATQQPASIRAAGKTAEYLYGLGLTVRLIINEFDTSNLKSFNNGLRSGIVNIIDRTNIQLIGVLPYSYELGLAQENGALADTVGGDIKSAFENITGRIEGESIPLLCGFKDRNKIKKTY